MNLFKETDTLISIVTVSYNAVLTIEQTILPLLIRLIRMLNILLLMEEVQMEQWTLSRNMRIKSLIG